MGVGDARSPIRAIEGKKLGERPDRGAGKKGSKRGKGKGKARERKRGEKRQGEARAQRALGERS